MGDLILQIIGVVFIVVVLILFGLVCSNLAGIQIKSTKSGKTKSWGSYQSDDKDKP